ncbi:MAG: hypothetical protein H8K07_01445 [Nitrospira sp.]|nr:hypothetical protein [Nitrospira sp.]
MCYRTGYTFVGWYQLFCLADSTVTMPCGAT